MAHVPECGTRRNRQQISMTDEPEIGAKFLESIYDIGFWHVCHGP